MVQWLGLCASTARGLGSIPGRGTKISQAVCRGQKKFFFPDNRDLTKYLDVFSEENSIMLVVRHCRLRLYSNF